MVVFFSVAAGFPVYRGIILPLYTGKLVATEKKTTNTDPRDLFANGPFKHGRRRGEAARSQARGCSRRWAGWGPEPAPCTLGPTSFFLFVLSTGQPGQARASRCAPAPHLPACLLACAQPSHPRPVPARRPLFSPSLPHPGHSLTHTVPPLVQAAKAGRRPTVPVSPVAVVSCARARARARERERERDQTRERETRREMRETRETRDERGEFERGKERETSRVRGRERREARGERETRGE